jgi:flavin-dependent dehydrogenase
MESTNVFVIGGGPAGLAAAIAARRKGFTVTLADGAKPPIDKACGEGLMLDGLAALESLGIAPGSIQGHRFSAIRFVGAHHSVTAAFPAGHAIGVRRTVLHSRMVDEAAAAGARLWWGTPVNGIGPEGVQVSGRMVPARWIIGADGIQSRVRHWAGLDSGYPSRPRFGFRVHYQVPLWSDQMELYWGEGCQVYVTPVGPREVCVAVISRDPHLRLPEALERFGGLRVLLNAAPDSTKVRGAVTADHRLRHVSRGRVALVGDASGTVDAITGEGLCLSFCQAIAPAESLACGSLAPYQMAHRRLARRPTLMSKLMLTLDQRPWWQHSAFRILAWEPRILQGLLAMHVGGVPNKLPKGTVPCAASA